MPAVPSWKQVKRHLFFYSTLVMVAVVPILTNYYPQRYEIAVQDLWVPMALGTGVALLTGAAMWRLFRRQPLGGYIAALLATLLLTGGYEGRLTNIYPVLAAFSPLNLGGSEGAIFSLIFIAIIIFGSRQIGMIIASAIARRTDRTGDILAGIGIAIAVTFALQFIPVGKAIAGAWPQYFYKPAALESSAKATETKPDIYYIVLDRYASNTVLANQFGYDNSDFTNYLEQNGFYVNKDAHQNYPYTTMSISSTMNADYHTDIVGTFGDSSTQTIIPYHRAIKYSSVAQKLKDLGYTYSEIGTWYEATNQAPLADTFYLKDGILTFFGQPHSINNFTKNELKSSVAWRFIEGGLGFGNFKLVSYAEQDQADMTKGAIKTLKETAEKSTGGTFTFAHMLIPHDPYYFNADGSINATPESNNIGAPIKEKYLQQLQYINGQMKEVLSLINAKSNGKAVIILQSDEGPYPMQLNNEVFDQADVDSEVNDLDMRSWSDTDLAMKFGNLAAYKIPGASDTEYAAGANNVDVFKLVLNTYFGDNQRYVSQCYYAYPNGRAATFTYANVTSRLGGTTECKADGTGPVR